MWLKKKKKEQKSFMQLCAELSSALLLPLQGGQTPSFVFQSVARSFTFA